MQSIDALFYDGKQARPEAVRLSIDVSGALLATHSDYSQHYKAAQVQVSDRVGNIPRMIALPQGGQYEIADNDWVDAWLQQQSIGTAAAWAHQLESKWLYVFTALVLTAVFSWTFFSYGLPTLSKQIAENIPTETDALLGAHVLEALDTWLFKPSHLDLERQAELRQGFASLLEPLVQNHSYKLFFRSSPQVGANAFALPSGSVVMTDELVELAENDQELYAILAHEIGHVQHRHALRTVLQSSAVFVIVSLLTGDIGTSAGFLAALPTLLVESKYSRDFETEADHFAFDYMQAQHIDTVHFVNIMQRLSAGNAESEAQFKYISSHPQTQARIDAFRSGKWD